MREILFRGKSDLLGWIEGWYCPEVNWGGHHFPVGITRKTKDGWLDDVAVIPETIGQFTGLTDKNGKKIFEGDIVKIGSFMPGADDWVCAIDWDYSLFEEYKYVWKTKCEVIGNIHDNPELLGGDWE